VLFHESRPACDSPITSTGAAAAGWPAGGLVLSFLCGTISEFVIELGLNNSHLNVGLGGKRRGPRLASHHGRQHRTGLALWWPRCGTERQSKNLSHRGQRWHEWRRRAGLARRPFPILRACKCWPYRLHIPRAVWPPAGPPRAGKSSPMGDICSRSPIAATERTMAFVGTVASGNAGIRAIRFTQAGAVAAGWPAGGVCCAAVGSRTSFRIGIGPWQMERGGVITALARIQPGTGNPFNRADITRSVCAAMAASTKDMQGPTPAGSNVAVTVGPATVTFAGVTVPGRNTSRTR
jgi:hypothetical protein